MYICLVKIYGFVFWPGFHVLEAMGACGTEGEKCELDQCKEEGVKTKAAVFVARKMDGGCGKQSLLGARE